MPLPHIDQLLAELGNTMNPAEIKIHLMQVLQSAYLHDNGLNEKSRRQALDAIKSNIHTVDPAVAGQSVLLYSRMGAQDNLAAILGDALQRKIISPLDFLREGAFQLPNIDEPKQQNALLATLISSAQKSGSEESEHMLMTSLGLIIQSPTRLSRIDQTNRTLIAQFLVTHEPAVRADAINFDLVSAIEYGDWLYSCATLRSQSEAQALEWITSQVTDPVADTKKIVAVMTAAMAPDIVRIARQSGQLDGMKQKVERDMAGQRPGTSAYSAFEAALEVLK